MSPNCDSKCGSCDVECGDRNDLLFKAKHSNIKKIYAIVSGKGGVGKSLVTSLLSSSANRKGYKVGILDGDVTGPSITKVFGIKEKAVGNGIGIIPALSNKNIKIISSNMLLEKDESPILYRAPLISSLLKQFYEDVIWNDLDFLFIDMPPGTGDVPLTVFQSMPLDGIIIVSSPQELVSMVVAKAINMAKMMNVDIVGLIENMSYLQCDNCNNKMKIFGESHSKDIALKYGIRFLGEVPIRPEIATLSDNGKIEEVSVKIIDDIVDFLSK